MRAMVLNAPHTPLVLEDKPIPPPSPNQILVEVFTCGVCRTDLHIVDGELPAAHFPLILGHQIIGKVVSMGSNVKNIKVGERIGIPWLGGSCGNCFYCKNSQENLCESATYTGYQIDGGFAEYCVTNPDYTIPIPAAYSDVQAAPLLCGGLIGFRAYRMAGDSKHIGFYGFGSAAHILTQLADYENRQVYAFTRPGDIQGQKFAKSLGAVWAGGSDEQPPTLLDAAIIFAPIGNLVPLALQATRKGGSVICVGIHMSSIPSFSYDLLYGEKILRSVTNLTRKDAKDFMAAAPKIPIHTAVTCYSLEEANKSLYDLRNGKFNGSGVIQVN